MVGSLLKIYWHYLITWLNQPNILFSNVTLPAKRKLPNLPIKVPLLYPRVYLFRWVFSEHFDFTVQIPYSSSIHFFYFFPSLVLVRLQTGVGPRRVWGSQTTARSVRPHMETRHRPLQQVSSNLTQTFEIVFIS